MPGAERPPGTLADGDAVGAREGGGECRIRPSGPVPATARGAFLAPCPDLRRSRRRDIGEPPRGPPHGETAHAVGLLGRKPAWEGTGTAAEVCGTVVLASAAGGHETRLAAVAQPPLGGRLAGVLQAPPCKFP
jgi:hypothetical protein